MKLGKRKEALQRAKDFQVWFEDQKKYLDEAVKRHGAIGWSGCQPMVAFNRFYDKPSAEFLVHLDAAFEQEGYGISAGPKNVCQALPWVRHPLGVSFRGDPSSSDVRLEKVNPVWAFVEFERYNLLVLNGVQLDYALDFVSYDTKPIEARIKRWKKSDTLKSMFDGPYRDNPFESDIADCFDSKFLLNNPIFLFTVTIGCIARDDSVFSIYVGR